MPAAHLLGVTLLLAQAWSTGPLPASTSHIEARDGAQVVVSEVTSRVDEADTQLHNLTLHLRRDVEHQLARIDWHKSGIDRRYLVSAAVTRLDSSSEQSHSTARCTVSTTVRDAETGSVLAIIQGRALAEDDAGAEADAERGALTGAAEGAVRAIPEAILKATFKARARRR